MIKRMLVSLLCGFGLGVLLSMWLAPSMISYWYAPPVGSTIMADCTPSVRWAAEQFVKIQLGIGAVMAFGTAAAAEYVARKRMKTAALVKQQVNAQPGIQG